MKANWKSESVYYKNNSIGIIVKNNENTNEVLNVSVKENLVQLFPDEIGCWKIKQTPSN